MSVSRSLLLPSTILNLGWIVLVPRLVFMTTVRFLLILSFWSCNSRLRPSVSRFPTSPFELLIAVVPSPGATDVVALCSTLVSRVAVPGFCIPHSFVVKLDLQVIRDPFIFIHWWTLDWSLANTHWYVFREHFCLVLIYNGSPYILFFSGLSTWLLIRNFRFFIVDSVSILPNCYPNFIVLFYNFISIFIYFFTFYLHRSRLSLKFI